MQRWETPFVLNLREGVKQTLLRGGGSPPLSAKKVDLFQTKCKQYSACPERLFFIITILLYCHPYLSTGSKEIMIKK